MSAVEMARAAKQARLERMAPPPPVLEQPEEEFEPEPEPMPEAAARRQWAARWKKHSAPPMLNGISKALERLQAQGNSLIGTDALFKRAGGRGGSAPARKPTPEMRAAIRRLDDRVVALVLANEVAAVWRGALTALEPQSGTLSLQKSLYLSHAAA